MVKVLLDAMTVILGGVELEEKWTIYHLGRIAQGFRGWFHRRVNLCTSPICFLHFLAQAPKLSPKRMRSWNHGCESVVTNNPFSRSAKLLFY